MRRDKVPGVAIPTVDISESGVADPYGILQHGVEYRLYVAWKASDDLEDFGGSGELL
jgi:hypothetical protein